MKNLIISCFILFCHAQLSDIDIFNNYIYPGLAGNAEAGTFQCNSLAPYRIDCAANQRIQLISFHSLNLTGTISPMVANLTYLQTIRLYNNELHSTLPPIWPTSLEEIQVAKNFLSGTVPAGLRPSRRLYLYNNHFHGVIPREVITPTIELVWLWENRFWGDLYVTAADTPLLSYCELVKWNSLKEFNCFNCTIPIHSLCEGVYPYNACSWTCVYSTTPPSPMPSPPLPPPPPPPSPPTAPPSTTAVTETTTSTIEEDKLGSTTTVAARYASDSSDKASSSSSLLFGIIGAAVGCCVILSILSFFFMRNRKRNGSIGRGLGGGGGRRSRRRTNSRATRPTSRVQREGSSSFSKQSASKRSRSSTGNVNRTSMLFHQQQQQQPQQPHSVHEAHETVDLVPVSSYQAAVAARPSPASSNASVSSGIYGQLSIAENGQGGGVTGISYGYGYSNLHQQGYGLPPASNASSGTMYSNIPASLANSRGASSAASSTASSTAAYGELYLAKATPAAAAADAAAPAAENPYQSLQTRHYELLE